MTDLEQLVHDALVARWDEWGHEGQDVNIALIASIAVEAGRAMSHPRDPILHAGITDCLPDDHPLAWTTIDCANCGVMVHAFNNETMTTWLETGRGPWCWDCFAASIATTDGVVEHEWAL